MADREAITHAVLACKGLGTPWHPLAEAMILYRADYSKMVREANCWNSSGRAGWRGLPTEPYIESSGRRKWRDGATTVLALYRVQ